MLPSFPSADFLGTGFPPQEARRREGSIFTTSLMPDQGSAQPPSPHSRTDSEQKAETSDSEVEGSRSKINEEVEDNKKVSAEEITEDNEESSKKEQIEEVKESNAKE